MQNFKKIILGILVVSILIVAVVLIRYNNVSAQAQDVENLQGFVESPTGLGDLNDDGNVNSVDVSLIMIYNSKMISGTFEEDNEDGITKEELDIDGNQRFGDSFDTHLVLMYAAHRGAGNLKDVTFEQYVEKYLANEENELE